ncbi:MAG: glucoamylase family protein [Chloroflexota bacterium]|nr:glucoamylase family protein [Chloroflexota bacterium]
MLDADAQGSPSEMTFDAFIQQLLVDTQPTLPTSDQYDIVKATHRYDVVLARAYEQLSERAEQKKVSSSGVEWFLDNYYVAQEAIEIIQDDLPEDYFDKLPSPEGKAGIPRIYLIAKGIVRHFKIEVVHSNLNRTLTAYQQESVLKMSELWALPLMLRLVLIEALAGTIGDLVEDVPPDADAPQWRHPDLDADEVVARTVRTLVLFDRVIWKDLFEEHARVEAVLRTDPARVYARMDFETRDHYRKQVERLAEHAPVSEMEVAQGAVDLAQGAPDGNPKWGHVGYYLIGDGEDALREKIGFKHTPASRFRQFFYRHNTAIYLGSISALTLLVTLGLVLVARAYLVPTWQWVLIGLLSLIPASSMAINLLNSILTTTLPPRILPKMDFSKRIPRQFRSMVAIPALLTNLEELDFLLSQLELHYLANNDPNIGFVLLTDFSDAPEEDMPEDEALLAAAIDGIEDLNDRYSGDHGRKPFYLFHRRRQWNPHEDAWIGWERKRGKLADFNRFLLEGFEDSFDTIVGDLTFMRRVRFVITLDADTIMPRDSANTLIATLAHPLNQAEFKPDTGEVVSGYTILQPRTEVKPTSVNKTLFTRIFAGDLGLDLYTRAVSDVYQDLFGEGIYVGKGIYDVAAFTRSLQDKVPQNSLLSHDLFEGSQGRAGLITDVVLFEDYPPDYSSQVERQHRWVRGDWQLLPWLMPRVPKATGEKEPNPFSAIDRWKIFDNLRRSLFAPATLATLLAGWLFFSEKAWLWTALILFVSAFTLFKNIVTSLSSRFLMGARANVIANISTAFFRWLFWIVFLPFESAIMVDAVVATLVRLTISHKRLLQWTTSAHTVKVFGKQRRIVTIWRRMIIAPLSSLVIGLLVHFINPGAVWDSLPLLVSWALSPQIAYWISQKRDTSQHPPLPEEDRRALHRIARRTWLYFERFIGPDDHWLPPDHFQEDPKGLVAHRTSPTNIGLLMLSTASAYQLGYIGVMDYVYRMNYTFETLDGLEKYRGHLLNWYDTQTQKTLSPRYVSTVDSGNFAACLIGLGQSLKAVKRDGVCPETLFEGIFDGMDVFCTLSRRIESEDLDHIIDPLHTHYREIQEAIRSQPLTDDRLNELLEHFEDRLTQPMNELIAEILHTGQDIPAETLQDLRYWSDAIYQHLSNIRRQIQHMAPWMERWQSRPAVVDEIENEDFRKRLTPWLEGRALQIPLADLPQLCRDTITYLENLPEPGDTPDEQAAWEEWRDEFTAALEESARNTRALLDQMNALIEKANFYLERMEFRFLFDEQREVFYLGYQVGSGKLDRNHYDLLASEARTASLISIAMNEVPRSHWLHMSRPFTEVDNIPTLISWNGSMFEYLMPNLFTHTYPETLLNQTSVGVVRAQIDYAKDNNVPWGVSESSYYRFDRADNYQYRGFGVPGLGRKRGLADDLVIAPYASLMAVSVDPQAVVKNIAALEDEGALGHFGFYESIDYTPIRLPVGQKKALVKSYMAHHQGMILVALGNFLSETSLVDLIHNDPRIESTELLLQEQIPQAETPQEPNQGEAVTRAETDRTINITPWRVPTHETGPAVNTLSNGKLNMIQTDTGSGVLNWGDIALTRWRRDASLDSWGIWYYIQDLDRDIAWSIGKEPIPGQPDEYTVLFGPHLTEIRKVQNGVRANLQTTISPEQDLCLQRITLTNQSNRSRYFRIFSYGEVALAPQATDRRHPAFNKMFIESNYDPDLRMLHFQRRKRSSEEAARGMAHLEFDTLPGKVEVETDRARFIGRGHDSSNPVALASAGQLSGAVGITLDPIFSVARRITLSPNQSITLNYLTLAAETRREAADIADQYRDEAKINNAFASAESASEKLLRALDLDVRTLEKYQRLLSRILYPIPTLRPDPDLLAQNNLGQSGLWPFGISGDYPVLLIAIDRQDEIDALQEALQAHTYWRKMGLKIDLVILNSKDSGYTNELNERILQAINKMDSGDWVNRRGGLFVLTASQMAAEAVRLLKTTARVMIDLKTKDLQDHLRLALDADPSLPAFMPTAPAGRYDVDEQVNRPEDWEFDNGIGGFAPGGSEYQIYLENAPRLEPGPGQITPAPWVNVIANPDFGFMVSDSGSSMTWAANSGENRLSPWFNDPVSDPTGETLYLRDEITGEVWSPTLSPAGEGVSYLVRHGQGYSSFESINKGFRQALRVYNDPEAPVKLVELTLTNLSDQPRRLTATYFIEWVLGVDRETTDAFIVPEYVNASGSLLARNTYSAEFADRVAFLTSTMPVHGLTTDRREFLGMPGDRERPAGLTRIGLSGQVNAGLDPCAALQNHLNFAPGDSQTVVFALGQGQDRAETLELAQRFSDPKAAKSAWAANRETWETFLGTLNVRTPAPQMDRMLNHWLPYQALSCRIWGRSAFYQSSGAYGFRDQLQDVTDLLRTRADLAREHILRAAAHQFEAGDVLHWWHPPSGRGVRTRISDDLLWLVYVTAAYVRQTGDTGILSEEVPFRKGAPLQKDEEERYNLYPVTDTTATLFEHCQRALSQGDTEGPHGLPLIGTGDWNDGMNRVGVEGQGESVWLAWFLRENHLRFAELCEQMNEPSLAERHNERAAELAETVNRVAWDNDWYLRAYYDDGTPLGSHLNDECQIDSLPQSWSILTGGAEEGRGRKAMKSVEARLVQPEDRLIRLFTPPFDDTKNDPGYIKGYPPGIRENGGQYTHAAIWAVWALTELGEGDKAFRYFDFLNPITHSLDIENANRYAVEPYVVAADIYSTPPFEGRGGWTWYTGSSGWLHRLGVEAILGLQLRGDHFIVNPCIPADWDGYTMTFRKNGSVYNIKVQNPDHVQRGVRSVRMDGEALSDGQIPLDPDSGEHTVEIILEN